MAIKLNHGFPKDAGHWRQTWITATGKAELITKNVIVVYRTVYSTRYRDATRQAYMLKYQCCRGWTQVQDQCSQGKWSSEGKKPS